MALTVPKSQGRADCGDGGDGGPAFLPAVTEAAPMFTTIRISASEDYEQPATKFKRLRVYFSLLVI